MIEVLKAAVEVQKFCEDLGWRFCFIGGIALPFEESAIARARLEKYTDGVSLKTCSAEDLIVMKGFASRTKDWADLEGIIIRGGRSIDWTYVLSHLRPLAELKEAPGIVEQLERLRRQLTA